MAGLEKTARKSLGEVVYERMERAIKSGSYQPDERLPTELDLAAEFQVSRPIIRDALQRLRDHGLIYSRRGAGSFVRAIGLKQPLGFGALENVSDLLSCYEFRLTLEPAAALFAATRHTPESLARIKTALDQMRDATNRQAHREDADFQFHLAIAIAAGNSYFSTAMEALKDHIAAGMRIHGLSVKREASGLTRVYDEHDTIFQAIRQGNGQVAHDLMHNHLHGSRERLFDAGPATRAAGAI